MKYDDEKLIMVVGSGLTGLMCALKLKLLNLKKTIIIIERESKIGGLYSGLSKISGIDFDHGMHLIYTSCNKEIDDLYKKILPLKEWHIYEGNKKDIAGIFYNGSLQEYSQYIDLRSHPLKDQKTYTKSFYSSVKNAKNKKFSNALEYLDNQFGKKIVNKIHGPILKRLFGISLDKLDLISTRSPPLDRIILFDTEPMLKLMKSKKLRARIAFPDQLNLPPIRENDQKGMYPKKFGMTHFIQKFENLLKSLNIEILTNTNISSIETVKNKIINVNLVINNLKKRTIKIERILWTAGWPGIAKLLNVDISDLRFDKGPQIIFLNIVFDKPIDTGSLYHFFCYDEGFITHRVTNYNNYCPASSKVGKFPVSIEIWPSKNLKLSSSKISEKKLLKIALNELKQFGVIDSSYKVVDAKMESDVTNFPMPSLTNANSLSKIRQRVKNKRIGNIKIAGVMAEKGLFFLPETLNDAFSKLR